jgi:hypothetical protein
MGKYDQYLLYLKGLFFKYSMAYTWAGLQRHCHPIPLSEPPTSDCPYV